MMDSAENSVSRTEQTEQMWKRYLEGASCEVIGKEYGMSRQLVRWRFNAAGKPVKKALPFADLTGMKFGKITVLERAPEDPRLGAYWKCRCDCGTVWNAKGWKVSRGTTRSCGCLKAEAKVCWKGCGEISGTYWAVVVRGAQDRELAMELTIDQAWNLFLQQKSRCAFTGIELKFSRSRTRSSEQTASLDRIDSSKGYILGNVQWVHKHVNVMKQATLDAKFIGWCMTIAHHAESTALCGYFTKGLPPSSYSYSRESPSYVPTFLQP